MAKSEQRDDWYYNEFSNKTIHSFSGKSLISSTDYDFFVNVPLQLGVGGFVKIKNLIFTPAFYYSQFFGSGYGIYTFSLGVLMHKNNLESNK